MQSFANSDLVNALDRRLAMGAGLLNELRARSTDGDGVTRASYGSGEQIGHNLMRGAAERIGLEIATDAAGNLYATLPGVDRKAPRWISGSHLDSVPRGGNFDGAAGAIAALVAVSTLKDLRLQPRQDIVAMAIRAEESSSWFTGRHAGHLGSRAALGLLNSSELETAKYTTNSKSLSEVIDAAGFDSKLVRLGPPPLSSKNVCGFIELHIEQGPVLVEQGASIGIVTGIRGTIRARNAHCIGAYSHSGAVPQDMRRDAVLATAELINRLDRHCTELRAAGKDIVFAVGRLHTDAAVDSLSKVPGLVNFTIDIRSQELSVLSGLNGLLDEFASEIGSHRKVQFDLKDRVMAEPTIMDERLRATLTEGAAELGIAAPEMPCGAGHDAAEFVRAGIPSCMIFVRNTGESHNPDERMELADFSRGVLLLTWFLARMVA